MREKNPVNDVVANHNNRFARMRFYQLPKNRYYATGNISEALASRIRLCFGIADKILIGLGFAFFNP